jgi:glycosyltransferase involved in cell wall biosynthesis
VAAGDSRIKVLTMVDGIGRSGGGESLARYVAQGLDPQRFESVFCVTRWQPLDGDDPERDQLRDAGVGFIGLERTKRFDLGEWRRLLGEVREREFDVIHSHKYGSNVWGALIARRAKVPVFVAHEHSWAFEGKPIRRLVDRRLVGAEADAYVVVSSEDERRAIEYVGMPAAKVRMIQNGIVPMPSAAPLDLGPGGPTIGTVASLRPVKNLDLLIRATAMLRAEFPDLRVLIAGGVTHAASEEGDRLEALVAELGAELNVEFLGVRSDVDRILASLDVAVLTSKREGSPLSVMEYMAAGLPVVATRVGGVPDIVADGKTGILVPGDDVGAFAEALARLLRSPELRREMGEAGRRRQQDEFTIDKTIARVEALYDELLAAKATD